MRLGNTEWPKVITLLAGLAAACFIGGAEAMSNKSIQDEWKVLCIAHSVERCPTLEIFRYPVRWLHHGLTSCRYRKWEDGREERECSVEVWRMAAPKTLEHEMAHVLQWLGGNNEGGHGRSFRRAYLQITGQSPPKAGCNGGVACFRRRG